MGLIAMVRQRFSQDRLFWLCAATVIVLIPLLLAAAWRASVVERTQEDADRVAIDQSWVRRSEIERVALTLKDAESSQRGYVITGDPNFLRRHLKAAAVIDGQITHLEQVFAAQPDQAARVRALHAVADDKFVEMDLVRKTRDLRGLSAAVEQVANRRGEALMEQGRAITEQMTVVEAATLARSLDRAHGQTQEARAVADLSFALVLLAILTASVMAFRYTHLRTALIARERAEIERRQTIFDSAMDAIITFNPSGGIETINRAGEAMFGYRHNELVGRDFSVLAARPMTDDVLFLDRMRATAPLRDGRTLELEARRQDGGLFPVDLNLGEMELPDGVHVVAVVRDVTERRKADIAKAEFVSTVSHELRTPLTSIAGSLGLLAGGAAGILPTRATRLISIAESNSRRLVRLINDILDIEKIESGKLSFIMSMLDLGELVRRAVDGVAGYADEHSAKIDYAPPDSPVTVRGDADRLTQVLTNLLSNAAKFSPRGGRVTVTVAASAAVAHVTVHDEGPGVPPEFRDRIFSRFAQADSSDTRQKGGTGLGLAITKEIVDRHGGRIWFDSPPGQGATFHVELPTDQSSEARPVPSGPRLLLCEDDADVAGVLSDALARQGFRVDIAPTLAEARAALADPAAYAALLLDLRLPDGSGLDLLQALRHDPATRTLPVIVVSGDAKDAARAGGFGLVDWIEKPLDLGRLQAALLQAVDDGEERPLVLHVDDDPDLRHLVIEAFAGRCRLVAADSLKAARAMLANVTPHLVILDVGLPDGSGLDLLPELMDKDGRPLPVVVFSAQGLENPVIAKAVDAVLVKSRTSLGQLIGTVRRLTLNRASEPQA